MRQNISLGACAWLYKLLGLALNFPHFFLWACVTLSGFHLLGGAGGEASPPTSPQKVLTINTISNNKNSGFMFFRALVIDTQKWAQKRCMLHTQLILASTQSSPPKQKILDETLIIYTPISPSPWTTNLKRHSIVQQLQITEILQQTSRTAKPKLPY